MIEIQAPNPIPEEYKFLPRIFLAGTIDMGNSENWQQKLTPILKKKYPGWLILNPRRDDWDSSWEQTLQNPNFVKQVNWEQKHLMSSTLVIFNFLEDSKSPITLMELGLIVGKRLYGAGKDKAVVICPKGYYRSGNVYISCERSAIPFYYSMEEYLNTLN